MIIKKDNGLVYKSSTKVPKEIHLLEPTQDTLKIVPDSAKGNLINLKISYVEKPAYFILYVKQSNFKPWHFYSMQGHDLLQEIGFIKSGEDTTRITFIDIYWELRGMDQNFATLNSPWGCTGFDGFWPYLDSLERLPIHQRSNIEGGNNVVGVFSSYNAAVKRFTAMALWDSVKTK